MMHQDWDPFADPADEDLEEDDRKVTVASIDANVASTRSTRLRNNFSNQTCAMCSCCIAMHHGC